MAYIPNPDDPTQPTGAVAAQTAAAEFRALKQKVINIQSATGSKVVRQSVLVGPTVAGLPSSVILSATALGIDLKGAATAIYLAFAAGFSGGGNNDFVQAVSTDQLNYWGALAVLNTTYLALDYNGAGNPTASKHLGRPQYGLGYDATRAALMQFNGANGSTTILDDFGNTWTAQGGAKIQNTQFKYGTGGLGGGGGASALDGATDYAKSTVFSTKVWDGGWSVAGWIYMTVLPTAGNNFDFISFLNAAGFGLELMCNNNAGTLHFAYNLSSDSTTNNIAALAVGAATPALNTWYYLELCFDKLAGEYRLYVNGTQDQHTTSALQICGTTLASIGAKATGANFVKGYMDKVEMKSYCPHPGGVAYTAPIAAPSIATAGYAEDWFSLFDWIMYAPLSPSPAAGSNPSFSSVNRLYVGEADTDALAVTAVRPYAYQGRYEGAFTALPAISAAVLNNHNIGTDKLKDKAVYFQCLSAENGYIPGEIVELLMNASGSPMKPSIWNTPTQIGFRWANSSQSPQGQSATDGSNVAFTPAKWQYKLACERGF